MKRQLSMAERVHPYVESAANQHDDVHLQEKDRLKGHPIAANNEGFNQEAQIAIGPRRQRRRRRCLLRCCCCVGACFATILAIIGILVLLFFLVLHPKLPKYTVTEASISKFSMSNSSSGSGSGSDGGGVASAIIAVQAGTNETVYLNVDMELTVKMTNPNKKIGIDYRELRGTLLYEGVEIGQGSIPPFYHGHKNTTLTHLTLHGRDIALTPSLASSLRNTLANDDSIVLHARSIVLFRIKIGSWKTHTSKVRVKCTVQVTNPARGTVRLLHDSCKFKLLRLHL